jgi:hypothetical protein
MQNVFESSQRTPINKLTILLTLISDLRLPIYCQFTSKYNSSNTELSNINGIKGCFPLRKKCTGTASKNIWNLGQIWRYPKKVMWKHFHMKFLVLHALGVLNRLLICILRVHIS